MLNRNSSARRVIFSDAEDLPKSAGSVLVAKRWDFELRLAASSRLLERAGQPGQRPPGVLDRELIPCTAVLRLGLSLS